MILCKCHKPTSLTAGYVNSFPDNGCKGDYIQELAIPILIFTFFSAPKI